MQLGESPEDQWLLHWAKHAFFLRPPPDPKKPLNVGLAVSGGGDSMAMLHLFAHCAAEQCYRLNVATVDHGLRAEAKAEAAFVAEICEGYGLKHTVLNWSDWDGKGNLQARARAARYELLAEWAAAEGCDVVCLGHTGSDVAETFLMRLSRNAGLDGLAAMEPDFDRHGMSFKRPFWTQDRQELREFLKRHNFGWCEDPSNEDPKFDRVKARHILEALEPLGISEENIKRVAFNLMGPKHGLNQAVYEKADAIVTFRDGDVLIDRIAFASTDLERRNRIIGKLLQFISHSEFPPRLRTVEAIDVISRRPKPYTAHGCSLCYDVNGLRITREYNAVKDLQCETDKLWDNRWALNGPHEPGLHVAALGDQGILNCPDWRETGLPRTSLLASPAVWRGDELVAAPLAGLANGWCARLTRSREQFLSSLLSH